MKSPYPEILDELSDTGALPYLPIGDAVAPLINTFFTKKPSGLQAVYYLPANPKVRAGAA